MNNIRVAEPGLRTVPRFGRISWWLVVFVVQKPALRSVPDDLIRLIFSPVMFGGPLRFMSFGDLSFWVPCHFRVDDGFFVACGVQH